jgi:hypothetical protein
MVHSRIRCTYLSVASNICRPHIKAVPEKIIREASIAKHSIDGDGIGTASEE